MTTNEAFKLIKDILQEVNLECGVIPWYCDGNKRLAIIIDGIDVHDLGFSRKDLELAGLT